MTVLWNNSLVKPIGIDDKMRIDLNIKLLLTRKWESNISFFFKRKTVLRKIFVLKLSKEKVKIRQT